ncbi:methyltransferase-like protein 22 isoform X3 [Oryzias melastigma]|uniref:methyltransferase-like protein 22 isoform X3 n=1 Tax=Oryzias melastigma TaxID=30732 RepID=UPI000CF824A9|nr:methyltransferase-like protein 22 isoform X3 [Oryzias melastigma]
MDQITFQFDMVLSDVHMHLPNAGSLMTRVDTVGQPVFMSRFQILLEDHDTNDPRKTLEGEENHPQKDSKPTNRHDEKENDKEPKLDEDGDLDLTERPCKDPKEDCGRDLVCPVILKQSIPNLQQEQQNLDEEEGCVFKNVLKIDVGEDVLSLCKRNVSLNKLFMETSGGEVRVRQLNWLQHDFCTDPEVEFSWTEEEVADLYDNTSFIIAADVCYDSHLTEGLFRTLNHLCNHFSRPCTIFISIEKRLNFSLRHMDVCCEAYTHFLCCLQRLQQMEDHRCCFTFQQLTSNFAQVLLYERVEQLELWKLTCTPLSEKTDPHLPSTSAANTAESLSCTCRHALVSGPGSGSLSLSIPDEPL